MFCRFCGQEVEDNVKFCPNCGKQLTDDHGVQSVQSPTVDKRDYVSVSSASESRNEKYTFMWAVNTCLKEKFATFSGRACRSEYWFFMLANILFGIVSSFVLGLFAVALGDSSDVILFIPIGIISIVAIVLIIPNLAVTVRRLHDRNHSGWLVLVFILLSIIPFVNIISEIIFIVIMATKGNDGQNRFGEDPLA